MWANTVWGLFSLCITFGLARLGMLWTHGYEWLGPWLVGASLFCFLTAFLVLVWPVVFSGKQGVAGMGNIIGTIQTNEGIITQGQSGGTNTVTINQQDISPKRRLRDFFNLIDSRILAEVAAGKMDLKVRMQPFEIEKLNALISEVGTPPLVTIKNFGTRSEKSQISNGTLGPQHAVDVQTEVFLQFKVKSFE